VVGEFLARWEGHLVAGIQGGVLLLRTTRQTAHPEAALDVARARTGGERSPSRCATAAWYRARVLTWGRSWGNQELVLDGTTVGRFDTATFRERTTVQLGTEAWEYVRQPGGQILGTGPVGSPTPFQLWATRRSFFTFVWDVVTPVARYELKQGTFSTAFQVLRDGVQIGEARRAGTLTTRFSLAVAPDVPLQDQVFLLWVVEASERRRSHGSSASTG